MCDPVTVGLGIAGGLAARKVVRSMTPKAPDTPAPTGPSPTEEAARQAAQAERTAAEQQASEAEAGRRTQASARRRQSSLLATGAAGSGQNAALAQSVLAQGKATLGQ